MRTTIIALALGISAVLAFPVSDSAANKDDTPARYSVSRFDSATNTIGDGWLFSAPGSTKSAMLRVYQNNKVLDGRKGSAWIVELQDDVDVNQAKALTNVRDVLSDRPRLFPFGRSSRQSKSKGLGAGAGRPGRGELTAAPAAPIQGSGGGQSITTLTTQVGEQIGDRIGEPIGSAIGSAIGKAVGQPIGRTIGGAIGNAITSFLPAPR